MTQSIVFAIANKIVESIRATFLLSRRRHELAHMRTAPALLELPGVSFASLSSFSSMPLIPASQCEARGFTLPQLEGLVLKFESPEVPADFASACEPTTQETVELLSLVAGLFNFSMEIKSQPAQDSEGPIYFTLVPQGQRPLFEPAGEHKQLPPPSFPLDVNNFFLGKPALDAEGEGIARRLNETGENNHLMDTDPSGIAETPPELPAAEEGSDDPEDEGDHAK